MTPQEIRERTYEFWRNTKRNLQNSFRTYGRYLEPQDMFKNRFRAAAAEGKRSGFEVRVTKDLDVLGIPYHYEEVIIPYLQPEKIRRYTPDLYFNNGVVVELKGEWDSQDRAKIKMVREQHPDIDLRMVFENPNNRISRMSKTTYAMVCKTLKIPFAAKTIPISWLHELCNEASLAALEVLRSAHL